MVGNLGNLFWDWAYWPIWWRVLWHLIFWNLNGEFSEKYASFSPKWRAHYKHWIPIRLPSWRSWLLLWSHGSWEHWHLRYAITFFALIKFIIQSTHPHGFITIPLSFLSEMSLEMSISLRTSSSSSLGLKFKLKWNMVVNLGNLFWEWAQDTFACVSLDTKLFETWIFREMLKFLS